MRAETTQEALLFGSLALLSHRTVVTPRNPYQTIFRRSNIRCLQKLSEHDFTEEVFEILPEKEYLILHEVMREKKQIDIARDFGMTQGAICHRIKKAVKRILFYLELPKFTEEEYALLSKYLCEPEVNIVRSMIATTSQSQTAEYIQQKYKIRCTQVQLRNRWKMHILPKVEAVSQLKKFYKAMIMVDENLYILYELVNKFVKKGRRYYESNRPVRKIAQKRYRRSSRSLSRLCGGNR